MAPATARWYAQIVVTEARKNQIDPWLEVAIVKNESRWISSVVGGTNHMCIGFGQICLSCDPSEAACAARKASLLGPATNLRTIAQMLAGARRYCQKRTGHAAERHYLAVYQGADARRHTVCGQVKRGGRWVDAPVHPLTVKVLRSRAQMSRNFPRAGRPANLRDSGLLAALSFDGSGARSAPGAASAVARRGAARLAAAACARRPVRPARPAAAPD